MKKQPQITEATRRNLVTAFWRLYETRPINDISIQDLTGLAGYHRATFYHYFRDIFDILHQEETELISQIEAMAKSMHPKNDFDGMMERIAGYYERNGKRLSLLVGPGGDPEFFGKFKQALYPLFRQSRRLPDAPEFSLVFEFGISGLIMSLNTWYANPSPLPTKKFILVMHSVIDEGIPKTLAALLSRSQPESS